MPRASLDQKLLPLAVRFANQVARVVERSTRQEVAAEVRRQLKGVRRSAARTAPRSTRKIVVECPSPGCRNPGVRTLMNFCVEHNRSLPLAERKKLREAQRQAKLKGAGAGAGAKGGRASRTKAARNAPSSSSAG